MKEYRQSLEQEKGKKQALMASMKLKNCSAKKLKRRNKNLTDAIKIVQTVTQQTQQELQYQISELITLALAAVFGDDPEGPYEFNITFVPKRGKTEAEISFVRNEKQVDPMTASGGGAVDVAAFALRVALWNLQKPRTTASLILDEPFRFVSEEFQPKVGEMLSMLSKKLNLQFIIVTHNKILIEHADKVFTVNKKKGISYIKSTTPPTRGEA